MTGRTFLTRHVAALALVAGLLTGAAVCPPKLRADDEKRALLRHPAPLYPVLARKMALQGRVVLKVSIDASGAVTDVQVETGHPLLQQAAVEAVRGWKWAPAAAASTAHVQVDFNP